MHIILGLIALAGAAYFWLIRARNAASAAGELADMAQDVMGAARRFGFRRKANIHPVEAIEDPDLAFSGAAVAFLELGDLPSKEQQTALGSSLSRHLGLPADKTQEAVVLGHWLVAQCGGAQPGITRLTRKLFKLKGLESLENLMSILGDIAQHSAGLNSAQKESLEDIKRLYRLT